MTTPDPFKDFDEFPDHFDDEDKEAALKWMKNLMKFELKPKNSQDNSGLNGPGADPLKDWWNSLSLDQQITAYQQSKSVQQPSKETLPKSKKPSSDHKSEGDGPPAQETKRPGFRWT